ncbi:hypothetical protein D1J63_34725 [Streptomyces sp. KPB2]|jgi:hypothetical protein|uniref:hypothetical protein n=1 Tax=Streptomyces TaxID=1883 RepID=UPI00052A4D6D|nr:MULTISPECIES: hypothetical protein [unclassified Streptomyces]MDA4895070.1 hypothetical protein [Streptomyces sp. MS2A]MYS57096.1 hypothetical protein [Streptomyces sp. SID6013]WSU05562.1 hypothetical protein OG368_35110 [Streptomyces sp. NBC_01124]AIV38261.1 hypothetical protein NI25_35930 [Streptomyces sp. CCM_MD2014]AZM79543.1 hypothetical protein D1J63_34725 [Streptomyces sp. KPB2]
MIKKLACVSVMAGALLVSAPVAEAAPEPGPSTGVPGGRLLDSLLGSLEVGHPATSPQSLLPQGILGR